MRSVPRSRRRRPTRTFRWRRCRGGRSVHDVGRAFLGVVAVGNSVEPGTAAGPVADALAGERVHGRDSAHLGDRTPSTTVRLQRPVRAASRLIVACPNRCAESTLSRLHGSAVRGSPIGGGDAGPPLVDRADPTSTVARTRPAGPHEREHRHHCGRDHPPHPLPPARPPRAELTRRPSSPLVAARKPPTDRPRRGPRPSPE